MNIIVIDLQRQRLLIFLIAIIFPWLFIGGPGYDAERSVKAFWDLGHIVFFLLCGLALAGYLLQRFGCSRWHAITIVLAVSFVFGVTIELIQGQIGRECSWRDVVADLLGAALGLFCSGVVRSVFSAVWRRCVVAGLALGLLWAMKPLVVALFDEMAARWSFPVLADFSTPWQWQRFNGSISFEQRADPITHNTFLRVHFDSQQYATVSLRYFPGDWSGYRYLQFDINNPAAGDVSLACDIGDREHERSGFVFSDRFNKRLAVRPGMQTVRIDLREVERAPVSRQMNMRDITDFFCFTSLLPQPQYLDFDNIQLLR